MCECVRCRYCDGTGLNDFLLECLKCLKCHGGVVEQCAECADAQCADALKRDMEDRDV